MDRIELKEAIDKMQKASNEFYLQAVTIGVHPFIEFTGLINEYISACRSAVENDIDFSQCNKHIGKELPLESFQVDYVNEKLECIFNERIILRNKNTVRSPK